MNLKVGDKYEGRMRSMEQSDLYWYFEIVAALKDDTFLAVQLIPYDRRGKLKFPDDYTSDWFHLFDKNGLVVGADKPDFMGCEFYLTIESNVKASVLAPREILVENQI